MIGCFCWRCPVDENTLNFVNHVSNFQMSEKSPITPLGDKVVIRPLTDDESNTKSASGIIIPSTVETKDKSDQGVVVAVGPGAWNEDGDGRVPMEVKEGDRVLFSSWREKVKVGEKEYFVISQSDIHGIITTN